jgi:probable F420-dependent oxidoreductase
MPSVGFTIPGSVSDATPSTALDFARRAEAAGAHSIWTTERIMDAVPDASVTLGVLAATTSHILIGTGVLLGLLRPPLLVAKVAATADLISRGRLVFGLGVGGRPEDFAATDIPIKQRGARMDELVQILKLAWSGAPVQFQGRYHSYDLGPMGSLPIQRPHPPLWFGGHRDAVMRRVARVGDGFIGASGSGVAGFRANWDKIKRYAELAGRDPAAITPAALIQFRLDDDRERARAAMHAYLTHSYGPSRAETLGNMVGTPDDLVRGASEYFEAGVEVLILASITADLRHLDRFCQEVLPRLVSEAGVVLRPAGKPTS